VKPGQAAGLFSRAPLFYNCGVYLDNDRQVRLQMLAIINDMEYLGLFTNTEKDLYEV
jgi:hypothetical protein